MPKQLNKEEKRKAIKKKFKKLTHNEWISFEDYFEDGWCKPITDSKCDEQNYSTEKS